MKHYDFIIAGYYELSHEQHDLVLTINGAAAVNGRMIDGATVRLARQVRAQAEYLGMVKASDDK